MQREIGPLAQLEGVRLDRSRHDPPAAADYPGRALRICEGAAHRALAGVCSLRGWMGARRLGRKREGLAQIGQGLDSYGLAANQHVLSALQADARLAIG